MTHGRIGAGGAVVATLMVVGLLAAAPGAYAGQQRQTTPAKVVIQTQPASAAGTTSSAEHTRQQLMALLERRPPSLGKVLRLDPTLLQNQAYLSAYPELAGWLAGHPEVARDPGYFLEGVNINEGYYRIDRFDPKREEVRFWENLMGGLGVIVIFATLMSGVIWLVKVVVQHRASSHMWRMQTETHNKLLDRFSSNEELLAYVQSPAGLRFLESTPLAHPTTPLDVNAPLRRVFWAIQAGIVIAAAGGGLLAVNAHVIPEMQQALFALGAVLAFVGAGFVVSGIVSYALTRRLGLLKSA